MIPQNDRADAPGHRPGTPATSTTFADHDADIPNLTVPRHRVRATFRSNLAMENLANEILAFDAAPPGWQVHLRVRPHDDAPFELSSEVAGWATVRRRYRDLSIGVDVDPVFVANGSLINLTEYRPLARLYGNFYASIGEPFTHQRMTYEEWEEQKRINGG